VVEDKLNKELDTKTQKILNGVWKIYGKHDAEYLELLAHNEEPWQKAREGLSAYESSDNEISLDEMEKYFSDLLKKWKSQKSKKN